MLQGSIHSRRVMPKSDNKKTEFLKTRTVAKIFILLAVFSMAYFAVGFLSKNGIKNAVKETANFVLKADAASSCPGLPSVVYDGDTYDTVLIGTQCWLKQNLNVTHTPSGALLTRYCYNNNNTNCDGADGPGGAHGDGGLYSWNTAMNGSTLAASRGICPLGWHIPTDAEQFDLEYYLKDSGQTCNSARNGTADCDTAGTKLKTSGSSGFEGIFAGYRNNTFGSFSGQGNWAYFWSSTQSGSNAWDRLLDWGSKVYRWTSDKANALSVRCIYDSAITLPPPNVAGFAWSENIGWISFNSKNCDTNNNGFIDTNAIVSGCGGNDDATTPVIPYGVNLDSGGTNNLSGYAWSDNVGWVSFNPADWGATCPSGTCQPRYDSGTGELSGWARALANGGGWDGWIKLRKDPTDAGADYGVSLSGSDFTGWAWGSDVVKWISFNSKNCDTNSNGFIDMGACGGSDNASTPIIDYKVSLSNSPPAITGCVASIGDLCQLGSNPVATFGWGYSDPDGDIQKSYQVQIAENNSFSPILYDSDRVDNSQNQMVTPALQYGHTYYYRVNVWDSKDAKSTPDWQSGTCTFNTLSGIAHQYPSAKFTYSPAAPLQFQDIAFDPDTSQVFGGSTISAWNWDFDYKAGNPGEPSIDDSTRYPTRSYASKGNHRVNLKVTDSSGYACWADETMCGVNPCDNTKTITIGTNNPNWDETRP